MHRPTDSNRTWFTRFTHEGRDVLPAIHEKVIELGREARLREDASTPQNFSYRGEILEHIGYFPTESDRHFPEYVPYYQHEDRLAFMKLYQVTKGVKGKRQKWYEDMGVKAEQAESIELTRSHESMSGIMEARCTGVPFTFSGNIMNDNHITNLPNGVCIELPVTVDRDTIRAEPVGDLPLVCAALNRTNIIFQEMVVNAIRQRSREAAYHALLLDPSTQAVLAVKRIREMFDEMWEAEGELLASYS